VLPRLHLALDVFRSAVDLLQYYLRLDLIINSTS
jgi:hypothetical protein